MPISSQTHLCLTRAGGLTPAAIDIVREEIAGAFRDKLGVSMVPRGQSYRKLYDSRFDHHPYPQGTRIPVGDLRPPKVLKNRI
jgi:hypothetical protein